MKSSTRSTRRRVAFTIVMVLVTVGVLSIKLVDIQVVHASELNAQAASARGNTVSIYGERGRIVDANGVVLADTVKRYNYQADPMHASNFKRTDKSGVVTNVSRAKAAAEIGKITGQSATEILERIASALKENPESQYALIAKNLDVNAHKKLDELQIPWLASTTHLTRTYPDGEVGS